MTLIYVTFFLILNLVTTDSALETEFRMTFRVEFGAPSSMIFPHNEVFSVFFIQFSSRSLSTKKSVQLLLVRFTPLNFSSKKMTLIIRANLSLILKVIL